MQECFLTLSEPIGNVSFFISNDLLFNHPAASRIDNAGRSTAAVVAIKNQTSAYFQRLNISGRHGRFFLYYSAPSDDKSFDHESIVAEYHVSKTNPDVADITGQVILKIPEPESNHNGGCLQFGKDGFLYIGLGDGGGAGDHHGVT